MKKWNEKNTFEKALDIISGIALCVWLVFEMLDKTNKMQWVGFVNYIAIFVVCVCQAFSFWNTKRIYSYIAIVGAVCLIAVIVLEIMLIV